MLRQDDLNAILAQKGEGCVSLSFATHRDRPSAQQDALRIKNDLGTAEQRLVARGVRATSARELLKPAAALLEDRPFWEHQDEGLALYLAPEFFRCWRVPFPPPEVLTVGRRFSLKPLLPLVSGAERFYILALSQHHVRLLSCTPFSSSAMPLPDTPDSLPEALWTDDPERQLQFHSGAGGSGGRGERRPARFHGHGTGVDDTQEKIRRYLRAVDKGVTDALAGQRMPLVLASVKALLPLYREISSYPNVIEEGIWGNPETRRDEDLRREAWRLLAPMFETSKQEAVDRFRELASKGRATAEVNAVALAAMDGRVDELIVAPTAESWGLVRLDRHAIEPSAPDHPEAEELVDVSIIETLGRGGKVYGLELRDMPAPSPLAATLRY